MSKKRTFELSAESDFIELNKLLKVEQVAQTGGHARMLIEEQEVKVNNEVELRIRRKLRKGDIVQYEDVVIEII